VNLGTVGLGGLVPDPIAMEHAFLQSSGMAQWYTLAKIRFQIICGHFRIPSTMHREPPLRYTQIAIRYRVHRCIPRKETKVRALEHFSGHTLYINLQCETDTHGCDSTPSCETEEFHVRTQR
jgi:hypothetical protein